MDKADLIAKANVAMKTLEELSLSLENLTDEAFDHENLKFWKTLTGYTFKDIVVHPCKDVGLGQVVVCEQSEAEYYGLYIIGLDDMEHHIIDFIDYEDARELEMWLRNFNFMWRANEAVQPNLPKGLASYSSVLLDIHNEIIRYMDKSEEKAQESEMHYDKVYQHLIDLREDSTIHPLLSQWAYDFECQNPDPIEAEDYYHVIESFVSEKLAEIKQRLSDEG